MKKLLTPSDWLLLGLGKALDIYQEIHDPFGLLKSYYEDFLGIYSTKYSRHNLSQIVSYNLKTQNIKKVIKNDEVYFQITGQGEEKITRKYPLLYLQNKPWDKKWRLVIYDIEEKARVIRDNLRQKLRELGFAQLQESVWVSPHDFLGDIYEFLQMHSLTDKVILVETENFFVEDIKKLAERLWHLDDLNNLYKRIYDEITDHKKRNDRVKNYDQNLKLKAIEVLLKDPYLPEEFLPDDWYGEKTRKAIKKAKLLI